MRVFDEDRYLKDIEAARLVKPLKAPNNKVPPVNLPKLAFDKKLAAIVVSRSLSSCLARYQIRRQICPPRPLRLGPYGAETETHRLRDCSLRSDALLQV